MYYKIILTLFFTTFALVIPIPLVRETKRPATCQACHPLDENRINVHLVPHSHDDVGWLKTVDQYYYGTRKDLHDAGVQYIIGSSIEALKGNPDRRYVQVESAFFWKWWQHQRDSLKKEVVELVNSGQLEITNGAWSMNDEAAANYQSTIDQFTWGFRFLNDSIGDCARPKIGWQIDPFGHSREHASLLSQMGFQGLVIGRIDHRDKQKRRTERNLDFIWQGSVNLDNSNIFTTMFPDFYLSPSGFCFDVICEYEPINDDETSPDYNLKDKVKQFERKLEEFKRYYKTSNFLVPMGGDFNYQAAEINFSNMDKLIKGFENHPNYNVFYSTPSCYVKAVNEEVRRKAISLTKKTDDFFPYASDRHEFWTGYFTSRPTSKRFERVGNQILQATKQLTTFSRINGKDNEGSIDELREAMGIMQHHDAITGTEKQAVAKDYARLLTRAIRKAEAPTGIMIGDLLKKHKNDQINLKLGTCLLANVSICETSSKNEFLVVVYNPLSRSVTHYVRLPVNGDNYKITGPDGEEEYDISDAMHTFDHVRESTQPSSKELVFASKKIPPLGIKMYFVEKLMTSLNNRYQPFHEVLRDSYFGTEVNGFKISGTTGKLQSVTIRGMPLMVTQDFYYYSGNDGGYRPSGAYIFRPVETDAQQITSKLKVVKAKKGKLVDEVLQIFSPEVRQIVRVYKDDNAGYIEFDWLVGDLKIYQHGGKEVVSRFSVQDFTNKNVFYTDSNGREQIKRKLNTRSDYYYNPREEPVSSNYYPVTSKIVIKDEEKNLEVAVLTDRAQGGTSLHDGEIELMVHRRLLRDDAFGVGEALNEREYERGLFARGQHYLTFGFSSTVPAFERDLAHRKLLSPWVLLADATDNNLNSLEKVQNVFNFQFDGLTRSIPENVKILTLEPWKDDSYLLRLEHVFEQGEDEKLSKPIVVHLTNLFTTFDITEIGETTLGANQWLDDYEEEEKLIWNKESYKPLDKLSRNDPLKITLRPMQIRTFLLKVVKK